MLKHDFLLDVEDTNEERSLRTIITEIGEYHGFTHTDMISRRKSIRLSRARQEAYWQCVVETRCSFPEVARAFGKRDHTTIMHGVNRHQIRLDGITGGTSV